MKYAWVFLCATSISIATPSISWGQPVDNAAIAEALFQEAQRLIDDDRVSEACVKFIESDRLDPGLGTKLSIADCYEREGKLAAAWAKFTEIIPAAQHAKRKDREELAKSRADALAPRVPKLAIVMDGADSKTVEVLRDGLTMGPATFGLALPIDPGEHVIIARSKGVRYWSTEVTILEGKILEVKVPSLEPEAVEKPLPPPPPPPVVTPPIVAPLVAKPTSGLRTGGFVALGVGAAGFITWGVTGALGISKTSTIDKHCGSSGCDGTGMDAGAKRLTLGNVATVGLGVGAVGAIAGVVMLVVSKGRLEKGPTKPGARAFVIDMGSSGTAFGVKGAF